MAAFPNLAPLAPELIVLGGAILLLMWGVFSRESDAQAESIGWGAIILLAVAGWVLLDSSGKTALFGGGFIADPFARLMKLLTLGGGAGALLLSFDDMREKHALKFEFPVLILLATAGMMLYGASLLYGFAGTTTFAGIATAASVAGAGQNFVLVFGLVFLMVGLAFKVSAVPFHMWTPDVYEGAPTPVTAFFAAAPKIAAMALLTRVMITAFPGIGAQWKPIVWFLAIASMLLGAFGAIGQSNIKRLMAYSSIANVGFALVGLGAGTAEGVQGVIVYMAIYMVMTLGSFACILAMRRDGRSLEDISELAGLGQNSPGVAFAFAMLMFSYAGIPPLAGFWSKWYVFLPAIQAKLYWLAIIGVLSSVVGAYYYLRIVKIMYFDEAKPAFAPLRAKEGFVMALSTALILAFVLSFIGSPMVDAAGVAATSLFR